MSKSGSMVDTLGYLNPFRYRGYVYDEETWMYWVKSRYYYPELHRFINADDDIRGNLHEYCRNNPINRHDQLGKRSVGYMQEMTVLHNYVAGRVALAVFGKVERSITLTPGAGRRGGPGYPDVIVTKSNMVWEIKPKPDMEFHLVQNKCNVI